MVTVFGLNAANPIDDVETLPVWTEAGALAHSLALRISRARRNRLRAPRRSGGHLGRAHAKLAPRRVRDRCRDVVLPYGWRRPADPRGDGRRRADAVRRRIAGLGDAACAGARPPPGSVRRRGAPQRFVMGRAGSGRQPGRSSGRRAKKLRAGARGGEKPLMCGIAGFVESPSVHAPFQDDERHALVAAMCDAIRHRGPDDEGSWSHAGVGARHAAAEHHRPRRAATSRFTTKTAPSGSCSTARSTTSASCAPTSKRPAIASTRRPTPRSSSTPTSSGDGRDSPPARDVRARDLGHAGTRTLLLARDRIGIKPLHYAQSDGRLYFGSEIKSILCAPDVPRELDLDALDHYLSFLYTPRDRSIFKGVHKLPPGHLLTWHDGRHHLERYWEVAGRRAVPGLRAGRRRRPCARSWQTRSDRIWSATCRSAPSSRAASIRASSSA